MLAELDPARTAGGEHRKRSAVFNAVKKLVSLLHNRKIRRNVHIENSVCAESSDSTGDFLFHVRSDRKIKFFAQGCSYGRRREEHNLFRRIGNCLPYIGDTALFIKRTDRAGNNALTAADTGGILKLNIKCTAYRLVVTALSRTDNGYRLMVTRSNTAHTVNTFIVVSYKVRGGKVNFLQFFGIGESVLVYTIVLAKLLKLTAA